MQSSQSIVHLRLVLQVLHLCSTLRAVLKDATTIQWLPFGGLYATYHLLGEPETTIEQLKALISHLNQRCYLQQHVNSLSSFLFSSSLPGGFGDPSL